MPFVPLGRRTQLNVVLDADKERLAAEQRALDSATLQRHFVGGAAPGASGYKFANHKYTWGDTRSPDTPFKDAHPSWRPPSADPDGPAAQRARVQAGTGSYDEGSHRPLAESMRSLRQTRSCNSLQGAGSSVLQSPSRDPAMAHPLMIELQRWTNLGQSTQLQEIQDMRSPEPVVEAPKPKQAPRKRGLVNFPKYMLYSDCHLKRTDFARFKAAEARRSEAEAEGEGDPLEGVSAPTSQREEIPWGTHHYGGTVPKDGIPWAGSKMPVGLGQRTSNPFRN